MELFRPSFGIKILLIAFFHALPLAAQTRADLNQRYGPIDGNVYRVAPGMVLEATFAENGSAKTLRIVADNPKGKNALLRADEVGKIIWDLVGTRMMCRRSNRSERMDVDCLPRKGCFGVKEEWKSASTLLVWHKKSVVNWSATLFDPPPTPPPGGIKLIPGHEHVSGCGIDTTVGDIKRPGGPEIRYDIGRLAGNVASRYANGSNVEWARSEKIGNDSVFIVLTKQNYIVATFEKEYANFFATISSQSDIDDFLKMVLTYKP